MKFFPSEKYLLVAKETPVEGHSGIIRVETGDKLVKGTVVEVGPTIMDLRDLRQSGHGISVGATIVFQRHLAMPVKCDNTSAEEHFILLKENVLGTMTD